MNTPLLPDALWNLIQPLLPSTPPRPKGGRPRLPERACLTGDFVRPAQWYTVGDAAAGTGLRFWHDLLAAVT
jgi:transposase